MKINTANIIQTKFNKTLPIEIISFPFKIYFTFKKWNKKSKKCEISVLYAATTYPYIGINQKFKSISIALIINIFNVQNCSFL